MPQTQKQKGDLLEYAVALIERTILAKDSKLRGCPAKVEKGKRFPGPIPTDADVWVTIAPDTAYQAFHIFECKNWAEPVGTDVVEAFNSKRMRLKTASATIVARSFTAPARTLAASYGITLLEASEELLPIEVMGPVTSSQARNARLEINFLIGDETTPQSYTVGTMCLWNRKALTLGDVVDRLTHRQIEEETRVDPSFRLAGTHTRSTRMAAAFDRGELFVANREVTHVAISFDYTTEVVYPQFTFKIGVENRGGLIQLTYPPGTAGHESLVIEFLTKPVSNK